MIDINSNMFKPWIFVIFIQVIRDGFSETSRYTPNNENRITYLSRHLKAYIPSNNIDPDHSTESISYHGLELSRAEERYSGQSSKEMEYEYHDAYQIHNDTSHTKALAQTQNQYSNDTYIYDDSESKSDVGSWTSNLKEIRYNLLDLLVSVASTAALILSLLCVTLFIKQCVKQKRHYSPRDSETCIYGYGNDVTSTRSRNHVGGGYCGPCVSSGTPSINSGELSIERATAEIGTQYEDNDVILASFVSAELLGELHDRDSTCTSVSEGFTYCNEYSPGVKVGVTEL